MERHRRERLSKIADGTTGSIGKWAFSEIPGMNNPMTLNLAYRLDFVAV